MRRPPGPNRTDTPFPYTTLFRSHVASQRFINPLGGDLEGDMGILRLAVPLEHKALHHMRDDVALEAVVRSFSKNRVRPDRPREIFVGNRVHPIRHMRLTRFARSEARRGGKEWVSTSKSPWSPYRSTKTNSSTDPTPIN